MCKGQGRTINVTLGSGVAAGKSLFIAGFVSAFQLMMSMASNWREGCVMFSAHQMPRTKTSGMR